MSKKRSGYVTVIGCLTIMILLLSASLVSSIISVVGVARKNVLKNDEAIAYLVEGSIENEFAKPITVSEFMASSGETRTALSLPSIEGTAVENEMVRFMNDVWKEFGYELVFCVPAKSTGFYTSEGLTRYLDENNEGDSWYFDFIKTDKTYALNVDITDTDEQIYAIFINTRVLSRSNELLGVTGVGVDMETLSTMLKDYEKEFDIDISLVNHDGLVLVDADMEKIEKEVLEVPYISKVKADDLYVADGDHVQMARYLEDLDLYLVITYLNDDGIDMPSLIFPSVAIFFVGLGVMLLAMWVFRKFEQKRDAELIMRTRMAEVDELTGTYNRNSYEQKTAALEGVELPDNFTVVVADINGLKEANDVRGHEAGDELIVATAVILFRVFGSENVYRVGGDEFTILLESSKFDIEKLIKLVKLNTRTWRGKLNSELTISIGYARKADYEDMGINELQHKADEFMYEDKNNYYRITGKNRRAF